MRVDVVALLDVLQYVGVVGLHALGLQLVVAALGTHLGRGGDEDLQFGVGEDDGAYVAAVHDDASVGAHTLLLADQSCTDEGQGGNGTDVAGDLERADVALYVLAVQEGDGLAVHQALVYVDVGHLGLQLVGLYGAVGTEESGAEGIEGDAAVHGSGVDVDVAHGAGQVFGHRALAARGVAVNGNGNLFVHSE